MNLDEYCAAFDQARLDFEEAVLGYGLPFEASESQPRTRRDCAACGHCDNRGASLWNGWLSPACLACRTGEETATFFISLKCTRDCYFCFNANQEDYAYHRQHERDIAGELRDAHAAGARFRHLAVTGGEPCLHPKALLAFVRTAKDLYPEAHVRVYTSGDRLDDGLLVDLRDAGLDEIRFSVKPEGSNACRDATLDRISAAVGCIPDVMVEMPVIPGTLDEMQDLLLRLDGLGARGINLLEFCFPLSNADAFLARGFELRRNPYVVAYNYWYAGGLPVAGSEAACLALLEFASRNSLRLGVHYCSLDNKFSGQIYQQNKPFLLDRAFAAQHAWLSFDQADYFLKCTSVFGSDVGVVKSLVEELVADGSLSIEAACEGAAFEDMVFVDESVPLLSFPLSWAPTVVERLPQVDVGVSLNVLEWDEAGVRVREVALNRWL